jgi:hypothetical protein
VGGAPPARRIGLTVGKAALVRGLALTPVLRCVVLSAAAVAVCACSITPDINSDQMRRQARQDLERWATAVSATNPGAPIFIGELTGQVGEWEEAVSGNNKSALMAGFVRAEIGALPIEPRPSGDIRWPDGTTLPVTLMSADRALVSIQQSAGGNCVDCQPLSVTAARLVTGQQESSRGLVTVPMWEFTVRGTAVRVRRVAVADPVVVVPPPWDANNPPHGLRIDSAKGVRDGQRLVVSFTGAPDGADKPCGADYTGEAVESDIAIVVIIIEHANPIPGACTAVGARRTATIDLSAPLAERTVLEVTQGLPVPVTPG